MSTSNIAVAIDGPAASGKSTVAKTLAKKLGLIMVNTGAMYRAVAWATIEHDIDPDDSAAVVNMFKQVDFRCGVADNLSTVLVDGVDPGEALRQDAVNLRVSRIAAIAEVRELLVEMQRGYLSLGSVVMEGRDIGSVVFPDTPFKIYIEASEQVRRMRRAAEGIVDDPTARDKEDSERESSPLIISEGSKVIDSSELTIEQVVEAAVQVLIDRGAPEEIVAKAN